MKVLSGMDLSGFDQSVDGDGGLAAYFEEIEDVFGDDDFTGEIDVSGGEVHIAGDIEDGNDPGFAIFAKESSARGGNDEVVFLDEVFTEGDFFFFCEFSGYGFSKDIDSVISRDGRDEAQDILIFVYDDDVRTIVVALAVVFVRVGVAGRFFVEFFYFSIFVVDGRSAVCDRDRFGWDLFFGQAFGEGFDVFFAGVINFDVELFELFQDIIR